jgi:hypothetical protein
MARALARARPSALERRGGQAEPIWRSGGLRQHHAVRAEGEKRTVSERDLTIAPVRMTRPCTAIAYAPTKVSSEDHIWCSDVRRHGDRSGDQHDGNVAGP